MENIITLLPLALIAIIIVLSVYHTIRINRRLKILEIETVTLFKMLTGRYGSSAELLKSNELDASKRFDISTKQSERLIRECFKMINRDEKAD